MKYADKIPYPFILDHLINIDPIIKPMFGCYGIYSDGKLCLFLMNRERPLARRKGNPMQKGVYIASTAADMSTLSYVFEKAEFEMLKSGKVWIFVSETLPEFEDHTIRACELISARDPRIGR
ncbi:MAG TPA: hypothetical protein VK468_10280 [Pyrinomonadaceae bacterium]|nr:hypothetical protein [Pyrinomonadaceae bacterium]